MSAEKIDVLADGRRCHCCGEPFSRCRETYRGANATVDVLAVIDETEQKLRLAGCSYEQTIPLRAARAAIAELVREASCARSALRNLSAASQIPAGYGEIERDLSAALDRIGGAA